MNIYGVQIYIRGLFSPDAEIPGLIRSGYGLFTEFEIIAADIQKATESADRVRDHYRGIAKEHG